MWGSDNWGETVWGSGGIPVPTLDLTALLFLVAVLLVGSVLVVRRVYARR